MPPGKLIHAILDNTPTSGSWINAVEGFFSALTRRRLKRPIERLDCAGLVILLHGNSLLALTADTARIRTTSGALLTYRRRPRPGAVPLWELETA